MLEPIPPALLDAAVAARAPLVDDEHRTAFRLFNGHLEGDPRYVIDAYATTAVIHHHAAPDGDGGATGGLVRQLLDAVPWLGVVIVKERQGTTEEARRGRIVHRADDEARPDAEIREHGVRYAVDLLMNQDASFYLDTRTLRRWLIDESDGLSVLNTFAYTGSLGVAACAGGAARVLHTDLNRRFLNVAKRSYTLNGFPIDRKAFQARDFFSFVRGLKLQGARFDLAVLDPPFFSTTAGGTVDLNRDVGRLVNRVRPLVRDGGRLVVVNNALYVSGADFLAELEALGEGGWLEVERIVGVPEDVTGFPSTRRDPAPVDPSPFPHSTKIAVLRVRHRS